MLNEVMLVGTLIAGPIELFNPHGNFTHAIVVHLDDDNVFPVHVWKDIADVIPQHRGDMVGIKGHLMLCGGDIGIGIGAERVSFITAETE